MIKWMGKKLKDDKRGFTLIELVVVIAILAILAAIAIPRLGASRKRAAVSAHNANVRTIQSAATMYIADGKTLPVDEEKVGETDVKEYLQEVPKVPAGAKMSGDGDAYTITITADGEIGVKPGLRYIDGKDVTDKDPEGKGTGGGSDG